MKKRKVYLTTILFCFFGLSIILCDAISFPQKKAKPWIDLLLLSDESDNSIFSACSPGFNGVEGAAPFNEEIGVHPIVLLSEGKEHIWNDSLPPDWIPEALSDTELVACIGEESVKRIQTCEYSPTGLPPATMWFYRYRYFMESTIVTARTGHLVDILTIWGSSPMSCPSTLSSTRSVYGAHVTSDDATNALSDYVNGFIVRRFNAPSDWIYDLAFDGTHLWLNEYLHNKLYKLSPNRGEVRSSFDFSGPRALAFDGTNLWVATTWDLYKIRPTTGEIIDSFDSSLTLCGLEYDGTYLWGTELYGDIRKISPTTGEIIDSFDAPENSWPEDLAFDGSHLWLADGLHDTIYKLDPNTVNVVSSFNSPGMDPFGLAFDGTHLWVVTHPMGLDTYVIYKINRR